MIMEKNNSLQALRVAVKKVQPYFERPEFHSEEALGILTKDVLCPVLEKVLGIICSRIEKRHKIKKSKHDYVIHYTSMSTILSILQNASGSSIRLYDSVHFNDPEEGNYLTRSILKRYEWLNKTDVRHAYIASFILPKEGKDDMNDNLVFWRTYGQEGEGCSLSLYTPPLLYEVSYGNDSPNIPYTKNKLRSILDLLDPLEIDRPSIPEKVQEIFAKSIYKSLERIRYLYKSKAYEHENECRFIFLESDIVNKDKIHFEYRDRGNHSAYIRHYYEHRHLQIKKLLRSGSVITLGPCVPYRDDVRECIEILKDRIKIRGFSTEIRPSGILYRKI